MKTDISTPAGSGGEQPFPPIREVWNALTDPLFLIDPCAARAYDSFMYRLRAIIENGEEGIIWAIAVLETANRLMNSTMWEQRALKRHRQFRSYIRRNAANLYSFARNHHARLGPGIVTIDWPSPEFPSPEDVQDGIEYMPKEVWKLGGIPGPGEEPLTPEELGLGELITEALEEYDPSRQAVVLFNNDEELGADVLVPTFIFGSPDAESSKMPSIRIH